VSFLRRQLVAWPGPVILASHDRAFLDEVATVLVDIDPSRAASPVTRFGGTYTDYLAAKAAERARWEAQFAAEEQELRDLAHAVAVTARQVAPDRPKRDNEKMGYDFKSGTVQAQVSRRVRNARGRLDELEQNRVEKPAELLSFGGIPSGSHSLAGDGPLIELRDVAVPGRLEVAHFAIQPSSRLLITGHNGAGKSTLLSVLAGDLEPQAGTLRRRKGLRTAMLAQDVTWQHPERSARAIYERAVGESRAAATPLVDLGLIARRDLDRPAGSLSLGQQRRLALAVIIARPPHVFLLDEPTNHLSLSLATELEEAIGSYPGAVVVASHDRWLRRRWTGPHRAMAEGRLI
jgi:macrolide transport system ATP-binding/permease protein